MGGCTLSAGIWNPDWNSKEPNMFLRVMGCPLCPVPFFVGLAAIVVGAVKSKKLKNAQDLLKDVTSIHWEDADLKLIFDALVSNPKWRMSAASQSAGRQQDETKIPKEDLLNWVRVAWCACESLRPRGRPH